MNRKITAIILAAAVALGGCTSPGAVEDAPAPGAQDEKNDLQETQSEAEDAQTESRSKPESEAAAVGESTETTGTEAAQETTPSGKPVLRKYTWYDAITTESEKMDGDYYCFANLNIDILKAEGEGFDALDNALRLDFNERQTYTDWFSDSVRESFGYEADREELRYPWPYEDTVSVVRADEKVVSYISNTYSYMGGAHGGNSVKGVNIETATGKRLELRDVINDFDTFYSVLKDKLTERKDEFFDEWESTLERDVKDGNYEHGAFAWLLGDDSIRLIFGDYELAPYASGHISVDITQSEVPGMIKSEYLAEDVPFHSELAPWEVLSRDMDVDGKDEYVTIEKEDEYDEEYRYVYSTKVKVLTGESPDDMVECADIIEDNDFRGATVMQNTAGKYFLYLEMNSDNDYVIQHIFDINDPKKGPVYLGQNEYGSWGSFIPQDPEKLMLTDRLGVLGTYSGARLCRIGDDGLMEPLGDEYMILLYDTDPFTGEKEEPFALKTKAPVNGWLDKEKTKSVRIAPHSKLVPLRTDGESYMVLRQSDGSEVYLFYDRQADDSYWPRCIDGQEEEYLFENLMYAG